MRAMILAAGRGERMRPLTDTQPKPLLKVGGKSLIEWHVHRLAKAGITHLVINHAWLGDQIEATLGDGRRYGVHIAYSPEPQPLETAGGIAKALPLLGDEPFLVMNGDIWCDWNPAAAFDAAREAEATGSQAWLLLVDNPVHHPDGDFSLGLDGHVLDAEPGNALTFTGVGVYQPEFFRSLDPGQPAPLAPLLYQAIDQKLMIGEHYDGTWIDVGTPQRLMQLNAMLAAAPSTPV